MQNQLSVKSLLFAMLCGVLALFAVFSGVVWVATNSISTAALQMGQGKDVVADILPPPLYVIEAELVVRQIQDAKPGEIEALLDRLNVLKKEYDDRNDYWQKSDLDASVRSSLLGTQKSAADAFWQLALGEFAVAAKAADSAKIIQLGNVLFQRYLEHRAGVDATVKLATIDPA